MYNNYYLLKRYEEENKQGIEMAKSQDDFSFKGEIVTTPTNESLGLSIGDKVIFLKDTGDDIVIEGNTYKIVKGENLIKKV